MYDHLQMTSVERVLDYTELESEAPWVTECRPPPDWPRHGVIVFEGVNFAYSHDGPHVLKNINAVFRSKEKVGILRKFLLNCPVLKIKHLFFKKN